MAFTEDATTLICLFHHRDRASAAADDLNKMGFPFGSVHVIGAKGTSLETGAMLDALGLPAHDRSHLLKGLHDGGVVVAVSAREALVSDVEKIFGRHQAEKIDEALAPSIAPVATPAALDEGEQVVPIVEEELAVGKRTVDQGGVRLYRRVVEIPVEESVTLREEHVVVERHALNRPVTDADLALRGSGTIELIETAEEAVIGKVARVVEEVTVGKDTAERVEHIHDTVRHTEVELEEVPAETTPAAIRQV